LSSPFQNPPAQAARLEGSQGGSPVAPVAQAPASSPGWLVAQAARLGSP